MGENICQAKICRLLRLDVFEKLKIAHDRPEDAQKSIESAVQKLKRLTRPAGYFNCPDNCSCAPAMKPRLVMYRLLTQACDKGSDAERLKNDFLEQLVALTPELILNANNNGQTALHLAILQENGTKERYDFLAKMIRQLSAEEDIHKDNIICPSDIPLFKGTKMEAGTILGVAALSTSRNKIKVFKQLMKAKRNQKEIFDLSETTKSNDNIIHSLIKYRDRKKTDKEVVASTMDMLKLILEYPKASSLLSGRNESGITPIQQAARNGDFDVFELLMTTKDQRKDVLTDGLIDVHEYNITDIETVPPRYTSAEIEETVHHQFKTSSKVMKPLHKSILKYIAYHQREEANVFVNFPPVRQVIQMKWSYYRRVLFAWFLVHLFATAILFATGYYRTMFRSNGGSCLSCSGGNGIHKRALGFTSTSLIFGFIYLFPLLGTLVNMIRSFIYSRKCFSKIPSPFHPYSNVWFIGLFMVLGPLIIIDSVLALNDVDSVILPIIMMIDCFLFLFFFQVFSCFSAFTVILQKVFPDMIRFAVVMVTLLIGFSMAMFYVMHGADETDDAFQTFPKALVKMVTIMIGLGEINDLFQSRWPGMSIIIFILFVLLTTILLLNALIAIMSNTCSLITTSQHTILQRLSVILYLEHLCIFKCLMKEVGEMNEETHRRMLKVYTLCEPGPEEAEHSRLNLTGHMQMLISSFFSGKNERQTKGQRKLKSKIKPDETRGSLSCRQQTGTLEISPQEGLKCSNCGSTSIHSSTNV